MGLELLFGASIKGRTERLEMSRGIVFKYATFRRVEAWQAVRAKVLPVNLQTGRLKIYHQSASRNERPRRMIGVLIKRGTGIKNACIFC